MKKKYAIIHKSQYCACWKKSFQYQLYSDENGKIQEIAWSDYDKNGQEFEPTIEDVQEYLKTCEENEEEPITTQTSGYILRNPSIEPMYYYFEDYQSALEALWDACPDDWEFSLWTLDDAEDFIATDENIEEFAEETSEDLKEEILSWWKYGFTYEKTDFYKWVMDNRLTLQSELGRLLYVERT